MKDKKFSLWVILTFFLFLPPSLMSKSLYKYVYSPRSDIYFGHISSIEVKYDGQDAVVLREGERTLEMAVLNLPLTAGDTIRTTQRRCEIRFDTGTSLRLDIDTELKLETILAQSLSSRNKLTNLVLQRGQVYILYRKFHSREVFQVITPQAAVKIKDKTVASISAKQDGSSDIRVESGELNVLFGSDADHLEARKIKKMQRGTVTQEHRLFVSRNRQTDPDLNLWSEAIESILLTSQKSGGFIPITLRKYRQPVSHFVKKFSVLHGDWMWHSYYGYVWRPDSNDDYPDGAWQPFLYGQWRELEGLLFWVPEETWGWVPYHLGLWMWDYNYGWLWLPGLDFAPAWVAWDYFWGFYAWRPWALWDWYYAGYYGNWHSGRYQGQRGQFPDFYDLDEKRSKRISRVIRKNQLKKKGGTQFTIPKKLEDAYKRVTAALKKGDERIEGSVKRMGGQAFIVASQDLNSLRIQTKRVTTEEMANRLESAQQLEQVFPLKYPEEPDRKAVWSFRRNKEIKEIRKHVLSSLARQDEKALSKKTTAVIPEKVGTSLQKTASVKEVEIVSPPKAQKLKLQTPMRIRDWNPDLKVARRMGVYVTYASRRNEVRCPDLGLTSRNVAASRGRGSSRGFYSSGGSGGSGSSSSGSSEGSSSGGPDKGSSGGKSVSSGSKSGGKVKK